MSDISEVFMKTLTENESSYLKYEIFTQIPSAIQRIHEYNESDINILPIKEVAGDFLEKDFYINSTSQETLKDKTLLLEIFKLEFDKDIEVNFLKNIEFRKFIIEVEQSLREFVVNTNLSKLSSRIFFEQDWELQTYRQIVLLLNFHDISFEYELKL